MDAFDISYSNRSCVFGFQTAWGLRTHIEKRSTWRGEKALDLGCGQGRDTYYLAQNGFEVDAVDISPAAINGLVKEAELNSLQVFPQVADIRSLTLPPDRYSVVVARTVLDHIEKEFTPGIIKQIKRSCKSGAAFFATVFTVDDPGYLDRRLASEFAGEIRYYFERNVLRELFADWDISAYEEVIEVDETHGPRHFHGKARIIALKP